MLIKPDTPKGVYTVSVGVKDADGNLLSAVDRAGEAIGSGFIVVGTLEIQ